MNQLWLNISLFIAGFALLTGGAEILVRGASRLAAGLRVPVIVIGLTIVAFGTSLPELLVSMLANLQGNGGSAIAIGNIIGSNIANLALILGVAAVMAVVPVERHLLRRELPLVLLTTLVFTIFAWNGEVSLLEGVALTVGLLAFMYYSYTSERMSGQEAEHALDVMEAIDEAIARPSRAPLLDIALIVMGLTALVFGANWLINSAQVLARAAGVSDLVIGLTLVAIGTSLPELATTVVAVRRNERDIAVGNVVGSNLFNMLFIGGATSLIKPISVPLSMRAVDFPLMLAVTGLVYILALRPRSALTRNQGILLLLIYATYTGWLFLNNGV